MLLVAGMCIMTLFAYRFAIVNGITMRQPKGQLVSLPN